MSDSYKYNQYTIVYSYIHIYIYIHDKVTFYIHIKHRVQAKQLRISLAEILAAFIALMLLRHKAANMWRMIGVNGASLIEHNEP